MLDAKLDDLKEASCMFTHRQSKDGIVLTSPRLHITEWPVKLSSRKIRNNNWSLLLFCLNDSYRSGVI